MKPNVLVVYYSRSGNTERVAREIARELDADVEELVDTKYRSGWRGYLRCALDARLGRLTKLEPPRRDPHFYDLVIVGTPVWYMSLSPAVRTYLRQNRGRFPNVAFFCTLGGRGSERVFGQMAQIAWRIPEATVAFRERTVAEPARLARKIRAFLRGVVPSEAEVQKPARGDDVRAVS